jgi:OmcA/MtrC family decaheme c-type cytochrome
VTVNSPPTVNFAVFSDGRVKADLGITNVSFAIAKLVPGSNGNPDQWVNYIYRRETATAGVGPNGTPALATAMQATTDAKQTDPTLLASQLVYNPDGYYTYTFKTDIKDTTQTNGVVFERNRTHRIAIQLSYSNAAGEVIKVNPYFDFTLDANGKSVAVTDPSKTRKMTDVTSCNGCHDKLGLHGGGRVDTQYCVMCHNPGTTDANSGNVLDLATMVHKIHAGKRLNTAVGGEDYTIWGYQNSKHSYADVGFPQDLRNCSKCHSAANASTPQGDNWKTQPSKTACLGCHASGIGSNWNNTHAGVAVSLNGAGSLAASLTNVQCAKCHSAGSVVSAENVHWNQSQVNAAKYKVNIESVTFNNTADQKARSVSVKYYVSDPTNGNAAYNLITPDCTYAGTAGVCIPPGARPTINAKFGNLRFYLAYQNMVGQTDTVTEYSAYNNGGSTANAYLHTGTNDGSNHYTVSIPLPDDGAIAMAKGTARVISIGQVVEHQLDLTAGTNPRPEVVPTVLVNTVVQHSAKELALSGNLQPRRTIVSNEKCNVCHGLLGTASGSNTLPNAFHSGGRTTVEACVVCHDANRVSTTVMADGSALNESYQFKRMIHGIHGNSKRTYPFTHGNTVVGNFCNPANTSVLAAAACNVALSFLSTVENFAAEVAWPGVGASTGISINCNACHVEDSYKRDLSPLGAVVKKDAGVTDPALWKVISPRAATCTSCHDSATAQTHVINFGGATFGTRTQADIGTLLPVATAVPRESCDDCHGSGGSKSVDLIHGQK